MHACFIPFGKRSEVELMLRDMDAQKHLLRMTKDGQEQSIYIQGQVRIMPFGVYGYVFPAQDMDMVLTTLRFDQCPYKLSNLILKLLRKHLHLEKIPEFKKDKKFLWINENVSIIPIGIKKDGEMVEPEGMPYSGFKHEAI